MSATGKRYSQLYLRPTELGRDSKRMRERLLAFFEAWGDTKSRLEFGREIHRKCGVDHVQFAYSGYFDAKGFYRSADLRDVLDSLTILSEKSRNTPLIISALAEILDEESIGFSIDQDGIVHPKFDDEFERGRRSTLAILEERGFQAAKQSIERMERSLLLEPIDGPAAIRDVFLATENVYKIIFSNEPRLVSGRVNATVGSLIRKCSSTSDQEKRSASKMILSFQSWIDAAHFYRHAAGDAEDATASNDFCLVLVSSGLSYLRWLASFSNYSE